MSREGSRMLSTGELHRSRPTKQQGIALVLALLVVSIVTAISVTLISSSYLRNKRVFRQIHSLEQKAAFSQVEAYAQKALKQDKEYDLTKQETERFDACTDLWGQVLQLPSPDGAGVLKGALSDLGGRFNVNSLRPLDASGVKGDPNDNESDEVKRKLGTSGSGSFPNSQPQLVFINLLMQFNDSLSEPITVEMAKNITAALVDWLDKNNQPIEQYGAEESFYEGLGLNFRPANRTMTDPSELLQVLQVIDNTLLASQLFELLLPNITVWPKDGPYLLNVNAMSRELMVSVITPNLPIDPSAQYPQLTPNEVESVNFPSSFELLDDLTETINTVNEGVSEKGMSVDSEALKLGIVSDTFELSSEVVMEDARRTLYTVLQRKPQESSRSGPLAPTEPEAEGSSDATSIDAYDVTVLSRRFESLESTPCP
ncbi:MAG: hypothetical protein AAGF06_04980 [Pseudomonadota bacterium]